MSELTQVDHDLHIHTFLSACCADPKGQTPDRIAAKAAGMGLQTIGLTDHVWANPVIEPSRWYRPQDLGPILDMKQRLARDVHGVRVLVGCEAETIAPGRFGITREDADQLDFVLLACSHFHMSGFVAQPASDKPRDIATHCLAFFRSAVESGLATAIPHSFLPLGYLEQLPRVIDAISDQEFADVFGAAADRGVAVEITTGYLAAKPGDGRPDGPLRFLELAKQAGCTFTFGSDAHDPVRMEMLPQLSLFVQRLGLTEDDIHPLARTIV